MYYKVPQSSPLFDKLEALRKKMRAANSEALALAKELSGHEECRGSGGFNLAGGISLFLVPENGEIPKGFIKKKSMEGQAMMFPSGRTKLGKELLERVKSLPVVLRFELNKICGIHPNEWSHPGFVVMRNPELILLELTETMVSEWVQPEGVIEITYSEYKRLFDSIRVKTGG